MCYFVSKFSEMANKLEAIHLRNGVKISFQFQANYFGVSQPSFEANSSAI